jgi:hypothetical protein
LPLYGSHASRLTFALQSPPDVVAHYAASGEELDPKRLKDTFQLEPSEHGSNDLQFSRKGFMPTPVAVGSIAINMPKRFEIDLESA